MKFSIHLHSVSCSELVAKDPADRRSLRPYVRFNVDGFRKLSTRPHPLPVDDGPVRYTDDFSFTYETQYSNKLHSKRVSIKLYSKNSILADRLIGRAMLDLHTLATGPARQSLPVYLNAARTGRVAFSCEMEQLCNVSLHIKSISVGRLPVMGGRAPISHLVYGYSSIDAKKSKSEKQSNSVEPEWTSLSVVRWSGTIREMWREGLEVDVMVKQKKRERSRKLGSLTVRIGNHPSFTEQRLLSVLERVNPTPDYAGLQSSCLLRMHCYYEGMPSFVQMTKGLHDERGVHDAVPFADGLPLPNKPFFQTRMVQPAAPAAAVAAGAAVPLPAAPPAPVAVATAAATRRRQAERSVMSMKAMREYDGSSLIRQEDEDEEEEEEEKQRAADSRSKQPPRLSSPMAANSTPAPAASLRPMPRSSSSGDISQQSTASASSSASSDRRARSPASQVRFLAYPPPPPPKPEPTAALRINLRALSISDPNNPFNQEDEKQQERRRRGSMGAVQAPQQQYQQQAGKYGRCVACGRPADGMCPQSMQAVCSYSCRVKHLQSRGLLVDDEKQRPPPLNPDAQRSAAPSPSPSSVTSAGSPSQAFSYPALSGLSGSPSRQPGPVGFCAVCQYPAQFVCRETLAPVCSPECKLVHKRLNPHLVAAAADMAAAARPPPEAPSAPSRTLVFGKEPQLQPLALPPACVVCGQDSEFRCSVLDVPVCSRECRQISLRRQRRAPSTPPSANRRRGLSCLACTFSNAVGATDCEMCGASLMPPAAFPPAAELPPSPRAPAYHLYSAPPPSLPARPSFAPVSPAGIRQAPGGPQPGF